ncbi:cannabidiolic acid synthase-like [Melia azedarach]|uniref:Cannabidiolic acid synthase-like n=1 Tax=Melia azedarach TaxID=155640 RepID=A0ACC1WVG9_MELAZ|nr:cannabidiolic acid synthase-like [Melia azedarach]
MHKTSAKMKSSSSSILPFACVLLLSFHCRVTSADIHATNSRATSGKALHEDFLKCLSLYSENYSSISKVIYTQNNSSYSSVLESLIQNFRFLTPNTPKPQVIVTPLHVSHVQATIKCSQKHGLEIRIRSGGHDFEGLSYVSPVSFVIVDLINLSSITVDAEEKIAWVQSGATIGQLYYRIAEKSKTLAFPAGVCPTVGLGGYFSGGGYGFMLRKFGLAADNIVDAQLIDAKGRLLDRKSMGEDLFWAIRGGGGGNFGVVVAWKLKLVTVPSTVTTFTVVRTLAQNATKIIHKWQYIASKLPDDLFIDVVLLRIGNSSTEGNATMVASFGSLFLGGIDRLLPLMQESFPELGLAKEDCSEMSWIESALYNAGFRNGETLDVLLSRNDTGKSFFKAKSDYVKEPIPENAFPGIFDRFYEEEGQSAFMAFVPHGGQMSEIPESAVPFPHRAGNLFKIQYLLSWEDHGQSQRHVDWIRRLYSYMTPYVSKNPREAYVNYRDLDIGSNNRGYTSFKQSSIWGKKYFKNNFNRLVHVKTGVDPGNFFRHEQSIPPLSSMWKKKDD